MKPHFHDPNNHVPPVSEDDDWDDVDSPAGTLPRSLPPMRESSGINEIKEGGVSQIDDETGSERGTGSEDEEEIVSEDDPKNLQSSIPSKRLLSKSSMKPLAAPKDSGSGKGKAALKAEKQVNNTDREERIVLPSQDVKRYRVKEIGSGDSSDFTRPDPAKMSREGLRDRSKMAGGGRRWAKDAEGAGWGTKGGTGNFKWIVFSGLGAMALVVAIVLMSLLLEKDDERRSNQSYFSKIDVKDAGISVEDEAAVFDRLGKSRDQAVEIYGVYATADEPGELKGLVHDEAEILPLISEDWKSMDYPEGWSPDDSAMWTTFDFEGIQSGVLEGQTPDYDRFMAVFRIDGEKLAMDWKATVGYGTSSFQTLLTGEGDGSEIRGLLSKVEFHTFSYPESDWVSYRLVSPSEEESIWVYAVRGSEISQKLSDKFAASQITGDKIGAVKLTLSIDPGNDESLPNQWEISELLSMSWLEE